MSEIIIGEGTKGCSAISVFIRGENTGIAENGNSYWIDHEHILRIEMTIFKNTECARILDKHIVNDDIDAVNKYLLSVFIREISKDVTTFVSIINEIKKKEFKRGSENKRKEVLKVLGLN